jgi:hypothetical protein
VPFKSNLTALRAFVLRSVCPLANTLSHISNTSPPRCVAAPQQSINSGSFAAAAADLLLSTVRSWISADLVIPFRRPAETPATEA